MLDLHASIKQQCFFSLLAFIFLLWAADKSYSVIAPGSFLLKTNKIVLCLCQFLNYLVNETKTREGTLISPASSGNPDGTPQNSMLKIRD